MEAKKRRENVFIMKKRKRCFFFGDCIYRINVEFIVGFGEVDETVMTIFNQIIFERYKKLFGSVMIVISEK